VVRGSDRGSINKGVLQVNTQSMIMIAAAMTALLLAGCSAANNDKPEDQDTDTGTDTGECVEGALECASGSMLQVCQDGQWVLGDECVDPTPDCYQPEEGDAFCVGCTPGDLLCGEDGNVHECGEDGQLGDIVDVCDPADYEVCVKEANDPAFCDSPCYQARLINSYRGCEYWAVTSANVGVGGVFENNFGVVVDNPNDDPATIEITGVGQSITEELPGHTIHVFTLPYNLPLKEPGQSGYPLESGIYRNDVDEGAYSLVSNLPLTAYQFSPYDFAIEQDTDTFYSYSNDASLLLPEHVLTQNYMVMSYIPLVRDAGVAGLTIVSPGTLVVVATADQTQVTVETTAYVAAGTDVTALAPDESAQYELDRGDVLQLAVDVDGLTVDTCPGEVGGGDPWLGPIVEMCYAGPAYDFSGTMVTADRPIAVWGAHNGAYVPFNRGQADHLEEMIPPLESWGTEFLVGQTLQVVPDSEETNVIRVLSGDNGVTVTATPAVVGIDGGLDSHTFVSAGEWIEFLIQPGEDFMLTADGPVMVAKYTVGRSYWDLDEGELHGDPAFGLVVPVEQYRSEYNFTTPASMEVNFVSVFAEIPAGDDPLIVLDGTPIEAVDYDEIANGYGVARIDVTDSGTDGAHTITLDDPMKTFGIEVYGYGPYTSYLYPGGLNLELINPL
jgi:hypothetical protein